jgi:hypothetical protein
MLNLEYRNILQSLLIGVEFEFYCEMPRADIARLLGPQIKKKIVVADKYHSKTAVTQNQFKLEPDFSGGKKMHELVTGALPYEEARVVIIGVLRWIDQNGWTDERTSCQINLSFDKTKIKLKTPIEAVNRLKFVLGFDEKFIYDRFPKRKNNIYTRSINFIYPINKFVYRENNNNPEPNNFVLPNNKYYGVNFEKLLKGYIEIRYMGGRGYEKKMRDILEIANYCGIFLYDVLQNNYGYSKEDIGKLNTLMREYRKVVTSFSDVENFYINYPDIKISVDLKADREIIKTYYTTIREKLFELIVISGLTKGKLNYDADVGKFQVKDAVIKKAFYLKDIEILNSEIQGNLDKCDLYGCDIRNSHIENCNLYRSNKVYDSRIISSPFYYNNESTNCFIDNRMLIINGSVDRGIIRSGEVGALAKISSDTQIIQGAVSYLASGKGDKKDKGFKGQDKKPISGIQTL